MSDRCRSIIALLQQSQKELGSAATLGMVPQAMWILKDQFKDQFSEATRLEEIIQYLVAQDLARQLDDRRARRASSNP